MDDVRRVILERRTVHDYSDQPIPEGALERALEAAAAAPNHRMTEPWRFTRVGRQGREVLARISIDLKTDGGKSPLSPAGEVKARDKILKPAELLVVSQAVDEDPDVAQEDYAAIACAVQNICLSLTAEGIGSKWSTGGVTTDPRTYEQLRIDSARERIVGFVWIGYSAVENPPKSRRRKSLADIYRQLP
jgi:nitroreductase